MRRWGRASIEAAADASAIAAGALIGGPLGAILMAPVPSLVVTGIEELSARRGARALSNAGRTVLVAAHETAQTPEELLGQMGNEQELLTVQALNAAAATTLQEKIIGLGRVLAHGLSTYDPAEIDTSSMIVAAIADLETPHIRVLAQVGVDYYPDLAREEDPWASASIRWEEYNRYTLEADFPEYRAVLDAVLAVLERHGLLVKVLPDLGKAFDQFQRQPLSGGRFGRVTDTETRWRITPLGVSVLRYIEAGNRDPEVGTEDTDA